MLLSVASAAAMHPFILTEPSAVLATLSCASSPVVYAPAMNERMWTNAVTQRNVATLTELGVRFVGPGEGIVALATVLLIAD